MTDSKPGNKAGLGCGSLALVVALGLVLTGVHLRGLEQSIPDWTSTRGMLVKAEVVYDHVPKRNTPKEWKSELRYSYTVNGVSYEGHRMCWGDDSSPDREAIERDMTRVLGPALGSPVPQPVTVYYSPGNPQLAVLEPKNRSNSSYGALVVAGIVGWLGLMILVLTFKRRGGRDKEPGLPAR